MERGELLGVMASSHSAALESTRLVLEQPLQNGSLRPASSGHPRKAIVYCRVSTDDKDQDPERQRDVIEAWAAREGISLVGSVIDSGTSGSKIAPFDRPAFMQCIAKGSAAGATAIVVEAQDRFTREGVEAFFVNRYLLRTQHGLLLWSCDMPLVQQSETSGRLMSVMQAETSAAWVERHSAAVTSGMARAKAKGRRMGRPSKPALTDDEALHASVILGEGRGAKGTGMRAAAWTVSVRRGAATAHDPTTRRKLTVSARWLERELASRQICQPCWRKGRRNPKGEFQPGICADHAPPA